MKNKVLVTIVTRNNPALIEHFIDSINKYDPGYDCDILILDSSSNDSKHLKILDKLSKKHIIQTVPNNRVEANYNIAWEQNKNYEYYFFTHDDCKIIVNNWLKMFIDKINSNYCEDIIKKISLKNLPIGKVGATNQPWRNYTSILGYPVQCKFLKYVLELLTPNKVPKIFKYTDGDRVLIKNKCMKDTNGFRHVGEFKTLMNKDYNLYNELCKILNKYLLYKDEGSYPFNMYPPGECWGKFTLVGEFMSSTDPLMGGWRTVGVNDEEYLEQIHGFSTPMMHNCVLHYGSPNFREFIGKQLNSDRESIKKHFNNKSFLLKMDKIYKDWQNNEGKKYESKL
jgi:hypothetical protein